MPISEIRLDKALEGLGMSMPQFIELCILLGCDYLEPIKGIGPKSALKLMKEYGSLEEIVDHLREKQAEKELQYVKALAKAEEEEAEEGSAEEGGGSEGDAEEWLWEEAKKLFEKPDVIPANEIEVRFVLLPWSSSHPSPLCHKLISSY